MPKSTQAQRRRRQHLRVHGRHQTSSVATHITVQHVNAQWKHRALGVGHVTERIEVDASRVAGRSHVEVARDVGVKNGLGASCRS
jgi:hypothetical protein